MCVHVQCNYWLTLFVTFVYICPCYTCVCMFLCFMYGYLTEMCICFQYLQSTLLLGIDSKWLKPMFKQKLVHGCSRQHTIHSSQKVAAAQMSFDLWKDEQMQYIRATEHSLATESNEVVIPATTWMDFENITLSARSQTEKVIYCVVPFIWNI